MSTASWSSEVAHGADARVLPLVTRPPAPSPMARPPSCVSTASWSSAASTRPSFADDTHHVLQAQRRELERPPAPVTDDRQFVEGVTRSRGPSPQQDPCRATGPWRTPGPSRPRSRAGPPGVADVAADDGHTAACPGHRCANQPVTPGGLPGVADVAAECFDLWPRRPTRATCRRACRRR